MFGFSSDLCNDCVANAASAAPRQNEAECVAHLGIGIVAELERFAYKPVRDYFETMDDGRWTILIQRECGNRAA